ncbi:MAG: hypothetical protein R3F35_02190 [Myxococcota bacterium]
MASTRLARSALRLDGACVLAGFAITWFVSHLPIALPHYLIAAGGHDDRDPVRSSSTRATGLETSSATAMDPDLILVTMGMGFCGRDRGLFPVWVPEGVTPTMASIAAIAFPPWILTRTALRFLGTRLLTINVLVIGATDLGLRVARMLQERSDTGICMLGFLTDDLALHQHGASFGGFRVPGCLHELEEDPDRLEHRPYRRRRRIATNTFPPTR